MNDANVPLSLKCSYLILQKVIKVMRSGESSQLFLAPELQTKKQRTKQKKNPLSSSVIRTNRSAADESFSLLRLDPCLSRNFIPQSPESPAARGQVAAGEARTRSSSSWRRLRGSLISPEAKRKRQIRPSRSGVMRPCDPPRSCPSARVLGVACAPLLPPSERAPASTRRELIPAVFFLFLFLRVRTQKGESKCVLMRFKFTV